MSSVATRRCWNARRIVCWSASLREKTTTSSGTPISPSSSRRTRTWPSEPVPPVTMTRLPSSKALPHVRVLLRGGGELGRHLRPRRWLESGGATEPARVEAAVDRDAVFRLDVEVKLEGVAQEQQETVLGDRRGAHMPQPLEVVMALDDVRDRAGEHGCRRSAEHGAGESSHRAAGFGQEPLEQAVASRELAAD